MQRIRGVSGPILGHYRLAAFSGLTTGLGANAVIFSARWATTQLLRAAITRLRITGQIITAFTGAQEIQIAGLLASGFTASDTGGTAIAPPPAGQNSFLQVSESGQASQFTDLRIASASAVAAGTRTLDTAPFLGALGSQLLAAAGAAQNLVVADFETESDQRLPLILQGGGPVAHGSSTNVAANAQGVIVTSPIAQGAGGTVRFLVEMEWLEFAWDSAETIN